MKTQYQRIWKPYIIAAASVITALVVRLGLDPWLGSQVPFITFFFAVLFAAWNGGLGPGLFSVALSALFAHFVFMPPVYEFSSDTVRGLPLLVFIIEALAIAFLSDKSKRTEAALTKSEERYRAFIANSAEGIWRFDIDPPIDISAPVSEQFALIYQRGRFAECNDVMSRMYGYSCAEDLIGKTLDLMLPPTDPDAQSYVRSIIEAGYRVSEIESKERDAHGQTIYFSNSMAGVIENGLLVRLWGTQRDITARKLAEAQLATLTEKLERLVQERTAELLSSQARLRSLAAELSLTEERERHQLATELHDHLAQLLVLAKLKVTQAKHSLDANDRHLDQAEDVLDQSLTYTRTLVADLSPPVLHQFGFMAALKWLARQMQRHTLNVNLELDDTFDEKRLREDQRVLLFQSIRELLMNVAKHARSNQASIRATGLPEHLQITVQDQGQGFDTEHVSSWDATKFGLFSIRERMKALNGDFTLKSRPGQGTTVTLSLPIEKVCENNIPLPESSLAPAAPTRPLQFVANPAKTDVIRILLVDDHAMVRQGLRSLLESYADLEVIGEAANGEEAVALTDEWNPRIVIMDINMPRMDGITATELIVKRHPNTAVIGLSVNADSTTKTAIKRAGGVTALTKEAAAEELYRHIQDAIHFRESPDESTLDLFDWKPTGTDNVSP
jgi:PAS domain S-box-containing protein